MPRPRRGCEPRPLRRSSGGVSVVPAATMTRGARSSSVEPSRRRTRTPAARPSSISRRSTRAPVTIRAPASQACGRAFRWTPDLALLGQPIAHWQAPRQPGALRTSGTGLEPEPLRALEHEPAVAAHHVERHRPDRDRLLDVGETLIEIVAGELEPVLGAPLVDHRLRRPVTGAGVDDRGAADRAADRQGDGRVPEGDRRAAVAVEAGEAAQRVGGRGSARSPTSPPPRRSASRGRRGRARGRRRRRRRRSRSTIASTVSAPSSSASASASSGSGREGGLALPIAAIASACSQAPAAISTTALRASIAAAPPGPSDASSLQHPGALVRRQRPEGAPVTSERRALDPDEQGADRRAVGGGHRREQVPRGGGDALGRRAAVLGRQHRRRNVAERRHDQRLASAWPRRNQSG